MGDRPRHAAALTAALGGALLGLACAGTDARGGVAAPPGVVDLAGRPRALVVGPGGSALVVHFWASWCPACVEELAALERAAAACDGARVSVLAVNVGEDADAVARYVAGRGLHLEVLRDAQGRVWQSTGARGLPANWLLTPAGASVATGPRTQAEWSAELRALGCSAPDQSSS